MKLNQSLLAFFLALGIGLSSCSDDNSVPPAENEEEVIDKVTLTFTPSGGGTAIVQTATDPDGKGAQSMKTDGPVNLKANTTYSLSIKVENTAAKENVTEEIEKEKDEHMFFFGFTNNIFADPAGDGNIDKRSDKVNYTDKDSKDLPLGLATSWKTSTSTSSNGSFRVVLKHQPKGAKTATSTATDGESDIDVNWVINIQ